MEVDRATGWARHRTGQPHQMRDRAIIAMCLYWFARIEAALRIAVGNYLPQGRAWWFRLHRRGSRHHDMPAHHKAEENIDTYIEAINAWDQKSSPLLWIGDGEDEAAKHGRSMGRHAALGNTD